MERGDWATVEMNKMRRVNRLAMACALMGLVMGAGKGSGIRVQGLGNADSALSTQHSSSSPILLCQADAPSDLLLDAEQAFAQDRNEQALMLVEQYIRLAPKDARGYFLRAAIRDASHEYEKALPDYDKAIELDSKRDAAYQRRGVANFMVGKVKEAVADFDKYLETHPDEKPQHWQRGIALYYAGRYEDGAKQFELHRTVNPEDVENATWHFICVARWKNADAAKAGLIPIESDSRIPMMKVHEMFAGKATAEDVVAEAKKGDLAPAQLNRQLFYAHLYAGLYCEAIGKNDEAKMHLTEAVKHEVGDYMYGVAKVHLKLLERGK
jgi:lipoprotein NlpI